MKIEEKQIPVHELKYYYIDRHGFVFRGVSRSSDEAILNLSNNLINSKIADTHPEFIVRINDQTVAFVYPLDCSFNSPVLYQAAQRFAMMGMFEVETLNIFLKQS